MTVGYIRVSTREQCPDRQIAAMREFGVPDGCMYIEYQSGKNFERPMYQRMVSRLGEGDVLVIKSIDRLGRNYDEILEEWRRIVKYKQADIVVLDMPLLDTRRSPTASSTSSASPNLGRHGRDLTGTLIADIVLQLLSYVAQTEREFIRQRQREGIAAARKRGVRFGRRPEERPEGWDEMADAYWKGELQGKEIAARTGFSTSTISRWLREWFENL